MCGIIAWAGKKPNQFNKDKFNITGILNEERGTHSCGVAVDGDIQIGVNSLKAYRDFAIAGSVATPTSIPTVIGHTRYATGGAHTIVNAHPFGFGNIDGVGFEFIGVHNGSLLNHKELAVEFGVSITEGHGKKQRTKIDSEILLEILYKTGNFKVLSRYNGAAALVWQYLEEPNVTYFYHGKSSTYADSNVAVEERPLYYWRQSKNSMYVSSIEESLELIGGTSPLGKATSESDIGEFDHNTVYKVTNGDVENAVTTKISRANNFQKVSAYPAAYDYTNFGHGGTKAKASTPSSKADATDSSGIPNIYSETPSTAINSNGGRVYFNKLRYWRNGHKINGSYTWIPGYGFYFLGLTNAEAVKMFKKYTNKIYHRGGFYDPAVIKVTNDGFIPFKSGGKYPEITNPPIYTFYDGIMLEHYLDYVGCTTKDAVGRGFTLIELSKMAKHPIIDLTYAFRHSNVQRIYSDGSLYCGTIAPLGSAKTYTIKNGNLVSTTIINKPTIVVDIIKEVEKEEVKLIAETTKEKKEKDTTYVDNDLVEDDIIKMFASAYDRFPGYKEQLDKYVGNERAAAASQILEDFLEATYELLTIETRD